MRKHELIRFSENATEKEASPAIHDPSNPLEIGGPFGFLHINTYDVTADVYFEGHNIGHTNAAVKLPAGRHPIELRPQNSEYAPKSLTVKVLDGKGRRIPCEVRRRNSHRNISA